MRHSFTAVTVATALVLTACGERKATQSGPATAPAHQTAQVEARKKLLVIDHSRPTGPTWKLVDGNRVPVLPAASFTTATISGPVRATKDASLTGHVAIQPDTALWSTAGGRNTAVPVVTVIGKTGRPTNWRRLSVEITHVVLREQDGSHRVVPANGWLVDAVDEISGVRCQLERPDFSTGQPVQPTVQVADGHRVVVVLTETITL
jgi:hypothetical protein